MEDGVAQGTPVLLGSGTVLNEQEHGSYEGASMTAATACSTAKS
jgi:hypothetical protein